ncbi:MAG TPA: hypothetical protein VFW96_29365 [Thermomicrobiales bacterium]|nr:hypothetical protein [Thermomicrobiales bacterium]
MTLDGGVFVQFAEPPVSDIQMQHYAFLVDDATFDAIYRRLVDAGIAHWADPQKTLPNQVNTNHGGRGVYFHDPAGHGLEVITRPYGQDSGLSGLTCPLTSSLAAWSENAESSVLSPESSR